MKKVSNGYMILGVAVDKWEKLKNDLFDSGVVDKENYAYYLNGENDELTLSNEHNDEFRYVGKVYGYRVYFKE